MSQILYHSITSPRTYVGKTYVGNTANDKMDIKRFEFDLSLSMHNYIIRKPRPAISGTVTNFKPKIHQLVPQLKNLTEEDIEKVIGESNKFDFDTD